MFDTKTTEPALRVIAETDHIMVLKMDGPRVDNRHSQATFDREDRP